MGRPRKNAPTEEPELDFDFDHTDETLDELSNGKGADEDE
jgi:hypothetical protein